MIFSSKTRERKTNEMSSQNYFSFQTPILKCIAKMFLKADLKSILTKY